MRLTFKSRPNMFKVGHETEIVTVFSSLLWHISEWNGIWNERAGLDFILRELIGSLEVGGVTNKMEADLKCQFAVRGGAFLATGFTADTQAWIG